VRDPDGAVVSFVRVGRDVTHLREIETSLAVTTRERAAFAHALARLQQRATPEATGQDITDEIAALQGISFAALLSFEEVDDVRMLALTDRSGSAPVGNLAVGDLLPAERATYLRQCAAAGPWAEPWTLRAVDGMYGEAVDARGLQALAYAPVGSPEEPIGLIALGTTDEIVAGSIEDHLPAAIEFAAAAGGLIAAPLAVRRHLRTSRRRIEEVIAAGAFLPVFQPIVDIVTGIAIGFEGLTRFADGTSPDVVFAEAWSSGIGPELEAATLARTIAASIELPAGPWLGLNVSPAMTLLPDRLAAILAGRTRPIVLEITEHDAVGDYPAVRAAVAELGPDIRMAVDDAGAGAANFTHIVELSPDFVKIDVGLIRGMDHDLARQALVVGLRYFAHAIEGWVVAEGIETEGERQALIDLGVALGQGYLFGRPADVEAWAPLGSVV
jgi:EAL domain-containing protein (putative c-di-GMP-specific phosphodiesterase class I)